MTNPSPSPKLRNALADPDAPLVLFAELTDLDPEPAAELLAASGIDVEVLQLQPGGTVDASQQRAIGLIAGYSEIGSTLIDQFPQLGIIATTSNGTDMVDVKCATDRGIWVTNVGHAATEEVAVHAFALMLAAIRELPAMQRAVAGGGWTDDLTVVPRRASELTLGVIGFGRIGQELARIAAPTFARVLVFDPFASPSVSSVSSLEELLEASDVVSLHLPLTDETRGLLGAPEIERMREDAILINTSRGELVDLEACESALDSGRLGAVGFDVLVGEPPATDHPLRSHPRAIVTPHAAFLSSASILQYETDPARYISEWHREGKPSTCVVGYPNTTPIDKGTITL